MRRFPKEFEALLKPSALKRLKKSTLTLRETQERFMAQNGLIDAKVASAAANLLQRAFGDCLQVMEEPIPEWTVRAMQQNYAELLPKTVRVRTALMESKKSKAWARAQDIGLVDMLTSASFKAFAETLSGYALKKKWGTQVLCYQSGDYTGPHNDHHPEDEEAKNGYVDVHVTFCSPGVKEQFLVYEKDAHFSHVAKVSTRGGMTCYRLPFWHYTTPLLAKPGHQRWVLLGTFLDDTKRIGEKSPSR